MNGTMIRTTILTLAALAWTAAAQAGDLPAQAQRIWAPTGDEIGRGNHATASVQVLDALGDEAKGAEDGQLLGETSGSGLLGWHKVWQGGYAMTVRAYGTNEAGGLTGRYGLQGSKPGHGKWSIVLRNGDQYHDRTSEMRAAAFKYPPAPTALAVTPHLQWRMADADLSYRLGDGAAITLGLDRRCRRGDKGSLLRLVPGTGAVGAEVPGVKAFDTTSNTVRLGGTYASGALDTDLQLTYRTVEGDRALDTRQVMSDDQQSWQVQLNAGYGLGGRTRLLGGVAAANLRNEGTETRAAATTADGETRTGAGRLGLTTRLGAHTFASVVGLVQDLETDARQDAGSGLMHAVERQRSRQELRADLAHTGLARTRLQLQYRYRKSDLQETTAESDLPGGPAATRTQAVDQDSRRHDVAFKARRRLGGAALLRAKLAWHALEVDEATAGDAWLWTMGDREQERLGWEVALQTRPARTLKLDLGCRGWDQAFTRTGDGTETTWQAATGFANLNWNAHERAVLYGTVSYGSEQVDLADGLAAAGTMGPLTYDGTTLRFMPGATLRVLAAVWLDAMYEGVRFEDKAGASALLDAVNADSDRVLLRARWTPRADRTVAATYRRAEFDENRWDDFIQDIWQVSVSARF